MSNKNYDTSLFSSADFKAARESWRYDLCGDEKNNSLSIKGMAELLRMRDEDSESLRREMNATEADIEELSQLAAMVEGTDCGVTLRELREGVIKISIRTTPAMDASAICAVLGGGGHRGAAGATVEGTMESVKEAVLQAVKAVTEA